MDRGTPADSAYAHLLLLGLGILLLADLALVVAMVASRTNGKRLLARRWSVAHVLVGFQAWLGLTLLVTAVAAACFSLQGPGGGAEARLDDLALRPLLLFAVIAQNLAMVAVVVYTVQVIYDQHLVAVGLS